MILSFYTDYNLFHEINVDLTMAVILEDEQTHESVGVPTTRSSKDDKPTNNSGTLWRLIDLRTVFSNSTQITDE